MIRVLVALLLTAFTLIACSPEPESVDIPVEVTRVITELVELEVTRLVEAEVTREIEVTRLVVATPSPTQTPILLTTTPELQTPTLVLPTETPLPIVTAIPLPTSTVPDNSATRKTGEIWFERGNRTIDLCIDGTPRLAPHVVNNRPIETYDLHTYIISVDNGSVSVYDTDGNIAVFAISQFLVIEQGTYDKLPVGPGEFEMGDCVFISTVIENGQSMPGPFVIYRPQ